jgi:ligand-binding sensor domain-containing protein
LSYRQVIIIVLFSVMMQSGNLIFAEEWKYFNKDNSGLSTNNIRLVTQDKKGNYWIASFDNGLIKFDGKKWTSFNTANSPLPHNSVYCITFDDKNNLWLGTYGGGIAKFDGKKKWVIYNKNNSGLPDNWIYSIVIDKNKKIWVATFSSGLASFNGKKWEIFNSSNSPLTSPKVTALFVDLNNTLWIGTSDSLFQLNSGIWKTESQFGFRSKDQSIYWISNGSGKQIIFCYKFGGIVFYTGNGFVFFEKGAQLPFEGFYCIEADRNGNIWATTFGQGCLRYDGLEWKQFNMNNTGLRDNKIFTVFVDKKNNKWFSTYTQGICIFNEKEVLF